MPISGQTTAQARNCDLISVTQHNNFESIIPILQGKLAFKTVIYTSSQSPEKIRIGCFKREIQKSFSCIKYFKLEKKYKEQTIE